MDFDTLKIYNEITAKYNNDKCADCSHGFISYVNVYFKVTLCYECANAHKLILPKPSNHTKSLTHDQWNGIDETTLLKSLNNRTSNDALLQEVPIHYTPLTYDSVPMWRKYFIFAKYIKKQFTFNRKSLHKFPERFVKDGILLKRRKKDDTFKKRNFVLQENGCLVFFKGTKLSCKPKVVIPINKLDLYLVPDKMNRDNGLQLSFYDKNSIHDIYLYSDALFDIIDWWNVIRGAKLEGLMKSFPGKEASTLLKYISGNIIKEGYMHKSGGKRSDSLKKRWFTLIENPYFLCTMWWLRYYKYPLDSQPLDVIYIGKNSDGYQISLNRSFTGRQIDDRTFTLVTATRSYDLVADSLEEKKSWINYLNIAFYRD